MVNLELTQEQTSFQEVVRAFLDKEIVPHRAAWDHAGEVDPALPAKMGELGLFGLTIPEEYGGVGGDNLTYCLAMEELGRVDSSVRGIVSVSNGLVGKSILAFGTEEQKREWLPDIASGKRLGCFALTEPDTGSDAGNLKTRAVRDGDDYIVDGAKMFITNGNIADVCLLLARTGGPGPKGISAFLVPTDTLGLTRTKIHGKLGLRAQDTAELTFENVRVPASAMLSGEGKGFEVAMTTLNKARVTVAAGCVGIIAACLENIVEYTTQRHQFGAPLASYQMIQDMIADISVDVDAARLLTWSAANLLDRGQALGTAASKAKYFASEAAVRAANNTVQAMGGYGFIDEYPAQKVLRDARVMTMYEGTSQIQKLLIGRDETGINAFTHSA